MVGRAKALVILFIFILALLFAVSNARAWISDDVRPYVGGIPVLCVENLNAAGFYYWGPGHIELHNDLVCRPLKRFWRVGYPTTAERRWKLGYAIFIVAHEAGHYWQDVNDLIYRNDDRMEDAADCRAAETFRPWARRVDIFSKPRRRALQNLIEGNVGYRPWRFAQCWR